MTWFANCESSWLVEGCSFSGKVTQTRQHRKVQLHHRIYRWTEGFLAHVAHGFSLAIPTYPGFVRTESTLAHNNAQSLPKSNSRGNSRYVLIKVVPLFDQCGLPWGTRLDDSTSSLLTIEQDSATRTYAAFSRCKFQLLIVLTSWPRPRRVVGPVGSIILWGNYLQDSFVFVKQYLIQK